MCAERLQASQQECAQLREAGEEARSRAAKLEAELQGLCGAYNALEAHCTGVEARLHDLERSSSAAALGAVSLLASRLMHRMARKGWSWWWPGCGAGQKRGAEAAEEEDDGMDDLLMCLGQVSAAGCSHRTCKKLGRLSCQ
jgi:hypothetical protein